ncbi:MULTISPECIES: FkbM family methyltransferase [unclassified Pedobacter]|uniref:FkbM family methyltransferase n=1 Tax=unclassified Pedobacter TaxID=2628915 RepID=UPI00141DDED3|nr:MULTISPECIES: FkbM family methyltransferase [unclassified Pedobacter]NII81335.1 FkbM family methyltransferase [Pedobacter sp. SG908]NMN35341.1 FkbM family methyltransferase [Pedobacter sp. SG918]
MGRIYYSQSGQDKYLNDQLFKNKSGGVYLDIGANDGITYSNTYFFEKELKWVGICIEPIPSVFSKLQQSRKSININGCVADFEGDGIFYEVTGYAEMLSGLKSKYDSRHLKRIEDELKSHGGSIKETTVNCYDLNKLLKKYNIDKIDYCSIDIEGGELDVLKAIDFDNIHFRSVSVENNYHDERIHKHMKINGFKKIAILGGDEIYVKKRTGIIGRIRDFFYFNFGFAY